MDSEIVDAVTEWESRPFSGGYAGLHDLADERFSGAVTEGHAWLFMLNGRAVGVFDGDLDAFADADGTAYVAPDEALPLLYTMKEKGGETRARYYTNDTSLSEADATLSSGNFTGYIELSENVLSGDYYVVYHGGRSMSVAYVGNSRQLISDDEAFERADNEVGIYEVKDVDVDIIEIPDPEPAIDEAEDEESDEPDAEGETQVDAIDPIQGIDEERSEAAGDEDGGTDTDSDDPAAAADEAAQSSESIDEVSSEAASPDRSDDAAVDEAEATVESETAPSSESEAVSTSESAMNDGAADEAAETETDESAQQAESASPTDSVSQTDSESQASASAAQPTTESVSDDESESRAASDAEPETATSAAETESDESADEEGVFSDEAQWREATAIPALDPSESTTSEEASSNGQSQSQTTRRQRTSQQQTRRNTSSQRQTRQSTSKDQQRRRGGRGGEQLEQLREQLQAATQARKAAEQAVTRLERERDDLAAERDDLQDELTEVRQEREEYRERAEQLEGRVSDLQDEINHLEDELESVRAEYGGPAEQTISRQEALDGTNLFVRYGSKGGATLEKAHGGDATRGEVAQNLRLEYHTRFDTDGLFVEGEPFADYLQDTVEYEFVEWVVTTLLYEIQETGHETGLKELYDAIPKIDRAELHGDVSLAYEEDGQENREQQSFDIVLRDRMGNPLIVADVNESRNAATQKMMTSLVENARRVKETSQSLGAAVFVTASFFEPEALETAADATGGGLLSRSKRESFVRLSRKTGFHLCLIETRNGDFHVNVPEL